MATSNPIPQIYDTARRVIRTAIQTGIPTFLALAGLIPAGLAQAKVYVSPDLYAKLVILAGAITAVASFLAWLMAQPAVNQFLTVVKLAGHSGDVVASDSYTTAIQLPTSSGEDSSGASN